jgi:hypothetical protein
VNGLVLFNGKDLEGWKIKVTGHKLNDNYANTFRVEDGILKVAYDNYEKFDRKFGHIFTRLRLLITSCVSNIDF